MTLSEFQTTFAKRPGVYDRQLLIVYDESKLILKFDVLRREADVGRLFDELLEMIKLPPPVLKRVEPTGSLSTTRHRRSLQT
jgi:hypothetical protein